MCTLFTENPRFPWFIGPKLEAHRRLKNKDIVYRQALLVLSSIYCVEVFLGAFNGWDLSWYWGGGEEGALEKDAICACMTNAIMETSLGVPFIYLVEQIFPFTLSRSICIAQMSGKYHVCGRKKRRAKFTSMARDHNSITLSLNRHSFHLYKCCLHLLSGFNRNLSPALERFRLRGDGGWAQETLLAHCWCRRWWTIVAIPPPPFWNTLTG